MSLKKGQKISAKKIAIAAITTAIVGGGAAVTQLPYFVGEKVIAVSDGDTFTIANNQRIRIVSRTSSPPSRAGYPFRITDVVPILLQTRAYARSFHRL